jgi:hypothetical protein
MPFKPAAIMLVTGFLVACASDEPGASGPNMALACQTTNCACVGETESLFRKAKTADVLWRANGDAYCPKGFALEKIKRK